MVLLPSHIVDRSSLWARNDRGTAQTERQQPREHGQSQILETGDGSSQNPSLHNLTTI
jgi:hypothetical protein